MAVPLNELPSMENFLGKLDLKTGSLVIAAICVVHPFAYACTLFMPLSYLIFTIWILLALFFAASILLFLGLINDHLLYIDIWIWYSLVFVVVMVLLMIMLSLVLISKKHKAKVLIIVLGILWYIFTVYFILVVNSHRKTIKAPETVTPSSNDTSDKPPSDNPSPANPPPDNPPSDPARMGINITSRSDWYRWLKGTTPSINVLALSEFKTEILASND